IEARPTRLVLFDDTRFELTVAIARCLDFHLTEVAFQRLESRSIPAVTAVVSLRIVLLIPQMLGHLALHGTFHHRFGELLQKPLNVFRLSTLLQPRVDPLVAYRPALLRLLHFPLLVSPQTAHTFFITPSPPIDSIKEPQYHN